MKSKTFIFLALLIAVLLVGSVGAYMYDQSRDDLIADGVTVGGIDVSGMRASEAREALTEQLAQPLSKPLIVQHEKRRFRLSVKAANVHADVEAMVQEALDKSHEGNILARTQRAVTGSDLNADLPGKVSYDPEAVDRMLNIVQGKLNRPAKDATVVFAGSGLSAAPGQEGRAVKTAALKKAIELELVNPIANRVVHVETKKTEPKVTEKNLSSKYPVVVTVDRANFKLRLFKDLKLAKEYTVAVGQQGLDTPAGLYHIQNKAVDPVWSVPNSDWAGDLAGTQVPGGVPENPLKARWLGIYGGAGIHGTDSVSSLGSAASHGCVRMAIPDVIELYDQVPVQTPIFIQ